MKDSSVCCYKSYGFQWIIDHSNTNDVAQLSQIVADVSDVSELFIAKVNGVFLCLGGLPTSKQ